MSHDNYDDGLVHSHGWARQAPTTFATTGDQGGLVARAMGAHPEEEPGFDDGLVHNHGWASAERGRMAHR